MKPENGITEINGNAPNLTEISQSSGSPGGHGQLQQNGLHHLFYSFRAHPFLISSSGNDEGAGSVFPVPSEPGIPTASPPEGVATLPIFSPHCPKCIDPGPRQPGNPSPVFGLVQATNNLPAAECLISPCQRYLLGFPRSSHPLGKMILPLALTIKSSPLWPEIFSLQPRQQCQNSPAVFSFSQNQLRRCWT
jgi:hypothetical protein